MQPQMFIAISVIFFDVSEIFNVRKRSDIYLLRVGREFSAVFFPVFNDIFFCSKGEFFYPEERKRPSSDRDRSILISGNALEIWTKIGKTERNIPEI